MSRILFIEDEDFLLQSFIDTLRDFMHTVVISRDGEEAIEQLKDGHDFDLVITDIMLPRGNGHDKNFIYRDIKTNEMGLEILRQLRDHDKTVPVIVLTASTDEDMRMKIMDLDVVACLYKPISLKAFLSSVEKALQTKAS
jgi:CheY-like chemotaxis protein